MKPVQARVGPEPQVNWISICIYLHIYIFIYINSLHEHKGVGMEMVA